MQRTLFAAFAVTAMVTCLLLSGCGSSQRNKLVGKWRVDSTEHLSNLMFGNTGPQDSLQKGMQDFAQNLASQAEKNFGIEVEFKSDGTLITHALRTKTGTWKYVRTEGDQQIIRVQLMDEPEELSVTLIDDDKIAMIPPNITALGKKLNFRRVTSSK